MEKLRELLSKSFDQELTSEEKTALADALETSSELREEKVSIEKMRKLLASSSSSFSRSFVNDTLAKVRQEQNENPQITQFINIFKRVAFSGAAAIIALLIAIYFIDGSLATDTLSGISDYSPEIAEFSFFDIQEIK